MTSRLWFAFLLIVGLMLAPLSVTAQAPLRKADPCAGNDPNIICPANSVWAGFTAMSLTMSDNPQTFQNRWRIEISKDKYVKLSIDGESEGQKQNGKILFVAGNAMLTTGLVLKEGYEIDSLDGPVLMAQLVTGLLQYAFPDGPKAILKDMSIDLAENTKAIRVATQSASGTFTPPWQIKGKVSKAGEMVKYDLIFVLARKDKGMNMNLSGSWEVEGSDLDSGHIRGG